MSEFNKQRQINRHVSQINEFLKKSVSSANLGDYRKPSGGSVDKLTAKDIDALISEITIMHSRSELYFKFVKRRVTVSN